MKRISITLMCLLIIGSIFAQQSKPNILLIAVDDLNDWVGAYGGHPQAKTPNIDRFAGKSMVFRNASCPGPVCGPSRSAFLSGFTPTTSGIYHNSDNMICSDLVKKQPTLPEYFSINGYVTISSGKIFHTPDRGFWAYDTWERAKGHDAVDAATLYSRHKGIVNGKKIEGAAMSGLAVDFTWGATDGTKEDTKDYRTAKWFEDKLQQDYDKPFFMLAGLSKPHLPFVVPQEYYDKYDLETLEVPEFRLDDLDDIVKANGKKKYKPEIDYLWIEEQGLHKEVVRAYLAATSYADDCVGIILDALENSKYANNTIVIIFGDHGWHLGEKLRYRKATLWKESTQLPFIFHMPGMDTKQECFRNVNLQDIYPSLIELCALPQKELLDGRSFKPLLEDVNIEWYPTITTNGKENHSVMYNEWHYVSHSDGVKELYNLENDPMEFVNLANIDSVEINAVKQNLKSFLPEVNAPRITTYDISITKEERKVMLKTP